MARYIDLDIAIKAAAMAVRDKITAVDVVTALEEAPTADVAPRAEVAREIFEEIDKIIEKHHSECYEYEDGDECDTAITYISYISVDIDDLKKKYTGANNEG